MELASYFEPIDFNPQHPASIAGSLLRLEDAPDWSDVQVALLFVDERRFEEQDTEASTGFDTHLLKELDHHFVHGDGATMVTLGRFKNGERLRDTESGLAEVLAFLIQHKVVPVVLATDKRITYAAYKAYARLERVTNITALDPYLNIDESTGGYIGRIIKEQPNFLFNYANLGFQTYLVQPDELQLAEDLYFEAYRLGAVRGDIYAAEPVIRGAEVVSCSMSALKAADFQSAKDPQPNGVFAEEMCQLMRYTGLTELNELVLIGDLDFDRCDHSDVDTRLLAEMIWCFIDGYQYRKSELPGGKKEGFLKYRVPLRDDEFQLVFYKSLNTDRWWMEVPVPPHFANKYRKHHLVPCDYNDYMIATSDDLPERWWKAYKKML
jgi:hypothetical protein